MATLTIDGAGNSRYGNRPFGNDAVYRFVVETGATGILLRSREATVPLAVNDVLKIGRLQAGIRRRRGQRGTAPVGHLLRHGHRPECCR